MGNGTRGKEEEIFRLLSGDAAPAELVRQGYSRGTVYKVYRRLRTEVDAQDPKGKPAEASDPAIESDPDIVALKKSLRIAELECQLDEIKGSPTMEARLVALETKVRELDGVTYSLTEAYTDLVE